VPPAIVDVPSESVNTFARWIVTLADRVGNCTLVAVTVTVCGIEMELGAV
jgi:hypothetical protein